MRVPSERLRLRKLPESVLSDALTTLPGYARKVAQLYGTDPEDMEEAAGLGAWIAWETFDPEGQASWSSWLRKNVGWYIADALREYGRQRYKGQAAFAQEFSLLSLNQAAYPHSEGEDLLHEDLVQDPRADFEQQILDRAEIEDILSHLLPRERRIFERRYGCDQKKADVALEVGISPSRVTQIEQQAKERLDRDGVLTRLNGHQRPPEFPNLPEPPPAS